MCGFCAEGKAVELAKFLTLGQPWPAELGEFYLFDVFYIEERHKALPAVQRIEDKLSKSIARFKSEGIGALNQHELITMRTIFCRVIETWVKNDFESAEYQELITLPVVSDVIRIVCQFTVTFDERLFEPNSSLKEIFQSEFFFTPHKTLLDNKFKQDCLALLEAYINWWHYGYGMAKLNLEYDLFLTIYPYIFMSYVVVETHYPDHTLINHLVQKLPHFGLTPSNLEAWLQHKAALTLFDSVGLDAFLPYNNERRSRLLCYLLAKNKLVSGDKQRLRESILQSGKYEPPDSESWDFTKKRHLIWQDTAHWIIEWLDN